MTDATGFLLEAVYIVSCMTSVNTFTRGSNSSYSHFDIETNMNGKDAWNSFDNSGSARAVWLIHVVSGRTFRPLLDIYWYLEIQNGN